MNTLDLVIKIGSMALIRQQDNDIDYNILKDADDILNKQAETVNIKKAAKPLKYIFNMGEFCWVKISAQKPAAVIIQ